MRYVCLFIGIFAVVKSITHAEEHELRFLPFHEVVYFYNLNSENQRVYSISPQIYKVDSIVSKDEFLYSANVISNHFLPPYDIGATWARIALTKKGDTYNWNNTVFDFPRTLPLDGEKIAEWPIVFPYFNKGKYHVGEKWEITLPAPVTFTSALDPKYVEKMKTFFRSKARVIQKFERVTDHLGFKCAEISYHIADSLKAESGVMMYFKCSGTINFAIQEGFIVSDMMSIVHDQLNAENKIIHKRINRKLRMLDYKPYTGK